MSQNDPNDEHNHLLEQTDSNLRGRLHKIARASFYIASYFKPLIGLCAFCFPVKRLEEQVLTQKSIWLV